MIGEVEKTLSLQIASLIHKDNFFDAAQAVKDGCGIKGKLADDPSKYMPLLQHWLLHLLTNGGLEEAAQILWSPTKFDPRPQSTKDIWNLFDTANMGLIIGAGSMSKSYSMGVRLFLEWIRDPSATTVRVIGPSEQHLQANLFSHLVDLHKTAKLPMPGVVGELFIGLSRRDQVSSIKGIVIPIGNTKKAGRIQGLKRKPRVSPHPIFGPLSRLFIFVDEIENVPGGLWSDVDNVLSNIQEEGVEGFKIFGAYNPRNQYAEVGLRAEPPFGWEGFDVETHFRWKSTRGWDVLRLDGERSENVLQNKIIYPGLQTRAGLESIARNSGGRGSAGYASMARGCYPPTGVELTIIPPGMIPKMRGTFIWVDEPVPVGSCDLALEGGANAVYTLGKWGKASGIKFPPTLEFPKGRVFMFKDRSGLSIVRWGLQADQQFTLPKGETFKMKNGVIDLSKKAGVRGRFLALDRTGAGAGVADLVRHEWSSEIHDVNYSEASSKDKIMLEDTKTCNETYERMNSELWFALKAWGEFNYFLINPSMDMSKLTPQLTQRKFRSSGAKTKIEPKKDYMDRGNASPDEADSLTLFVHAARKGQGVVLSMKMDESADLPGDDMDGFYDEMILTGGARLDASNRFDYLDDGSRPMEEALL